MPTPGRLTFRCRHCLHVVSRHAVADLAAALASLAGIGRTAIGDDGPDARLVEAHECRPGVFGVLDLIGGQAQSARTDEHHDRNSPDL